jgi:hypothetical protein
MKFIFEDDNGEVLEIEITATTEGASIQAKIPRGTASTTKIKEILVAAGMVEVIDNQAAFLRDFAKLQ